MNKKFKDLTGKQFGRLTVVRLTDEHYFTSVVWECTCICGITKNVPAPLLNRGYTKSCGCLNVAAYGAAYANTRFIAQRNKSIKRGITWELTREQYNNLSQQPCDYCFKEPSELIQSYAARCHGANKHSLITYLDDNEGYTGGNSIPVCRTCLKQINSYRHFRSR